MFSDESLSPPSILYVLANLVLNISAIRILKIGGAVEINLASMALVPINSLLFCLPIPLLGATPFSLYFVSGLAVVVGGTQSILCSVLSCPAPLIISSMIRALKSVATLDLTDDQPFEDRYD